MGLFSHYVLSFKRSIKQYYNKVKITSDTTIWNIKLQYLKALTKTICYLLQSAENTTKNDPVTERSSHKPHSRNGFAAV